LSAPRLRLTIPKGPLDLAYARRALFGALWAWSKSGSVVASNENPTALDDLEWLGIEPDAMTSAPKLDRYIASVEALVEAGAAYPCFCTTAQFREMPAAPHGSTEPVIYDGRCRRLGRGDRAALMKSGRVRRYRLAIPEEKRELPAPWAGLPWPEQDPTVLIVGGEVSTAFATAVDDHSAKSSITVFTDQDTDWQVLRVLVDLALEHALPQAVCVPTWAGTTATVSELRELGHTPRSLVRALLLDVWTPEKLAAVEDMAPAFSLDGIQATAPTLDDDALRKITGQTLAELDDAALLEALMEHLTRRGYTVTDFDHKWQQRFTEAVRPTLSTLADSEGLAGVLTTSTVDYTRDVTRVLSRPGVSNVLDWFEATMAKVDDGDAAAWRVAIQTYRQEAPSPGRALSTLRMVLTGGREGPALPPILALLGHQRCSERLDKARRHLP
jgi:glutamyl/glutaminyl-tRNA synthetase